MLVVADDSEGPASVLARAEKDQADLPRSAGLAENGAQVDPVRGDRAHP